MDCIRIYLSVSHYSVVLCAKRYIVNIRISDTSCDFLVAEFCCQQIFKITTFSKMFYLIG